MNDEVTLWKGSPSQWLNFWPFVFTILVATGIGVGGVFFFPLWVALVIPLIYGGWRHLLVKWQTFELTSERLRVTKGVINQRIDEVELYRVKDHLLVRPFWMRITGLATVLLETSDRTLPTVEIPAVRGGAELREQIRKQVELIRDKKRVREVDMEETITPESFGHEG
ncbi:MAG: PH domain-containing protein [Luteolibacter sp.]